MTAEWGVIMAALHLLAIKNPQSLVRSDSPSLPDVSSRFHRHKLLLQPYGWILSLNLGKKSGFWESGKIRNSTALVLPWTLFDFFSFFLLKTPVLFIWFSIFPPCIQGERKWWWWCWWWWCWWWWYGPLSSGHPTVCLFSHSGKLLAQTGMSWSSSGQLNK